MKFIPHQYQRFSIDWILNHERCGLLLPMGLGKTAPTLFAIEQLMHDSFEIFKVLVIAPPRVAMSTWSDEIDKWDELHLSYAKVVGPNKKKRIEALEQEADIYLVNNENLVWLVKYLQEQGRDWPFDMIVIDEWSKYKSSKTIGFRVLKKVMPLTKRFVGLTGTPNPNGYPDLWSQMYLLDFGARLGRTLTAFRDRFLVAGRRNGHIVYEWNLREGAKQSIDEKMSDVCFSLSAEDWITLPERMDHIVNAELSEDVMKKYKQFERDSILPLSDDEAITGVSAGVVTNKLLQFANGAIYDDDKKVLHLHDTKLDALDELLDQSNGQPVLVFYAYQHDFDRIKARHPEAQKLDTDEDLKNWNAGKIPLLVCHPASIGHGLNMQSGGNIIIWFGLTWSLELYLQANARLHRQGQTEKVFIYHIIAKGTVDENVMKSLKEKNLTQQSLLEALKAKIQNDECIRVM